MPIYKNISGTVKDEFTIGNLDKVGLRIYNNKLQGKNVDGQYIDLIYVPFNNHHHEVSDVLLSSTTSTTYQNKLTLTTDSISSGKYRIGWVYEFTSSKSNFIAQIIIDGSTELQNPNAGSGTKINAWTSASGFDYVNLTDGIHSISINYRSSKNNKQVNIRNTKIELWRIS